MNSPDFLLALLIVALAVAYGLIAGRAQAARLRQLKDDVSNGKLRGILIIFFVIIMVVVSSIF